MNNICTAQNQDENIHLLKAQRRLYSIAKRYSFVEFLISVPVVVSLTVVSAFYPKYALLNAYVSVLVLFLGPFLRSLSEGYREKAAQVQSRFDTNVLEVDTNEYLIASRITHEDIKYHADRISARDDQSLHDWYPSAVCGLSISKARLICQRSNCHWNFTQRKRYIAALLILFVAALALILGFGIWSGTTLGDFLLSVVVPSLPILSWGLYEVNAHRKSLDELRSLKDRFEQVFDQIISTGLSDDQLVIHGVQIQDTLFIRRSSDPLVPGFVYWLLRDEQESGMQFWQNGW